MDLQSAWYLGVTVLFFLIFAGIAARTYSRKNRTRGEAPKYRMMEDEQPEKPEQKEGGNGPRTR